MKLRKFTAAVLAVIMGISVLTACGSNETEEAVMNMNFVSDVKPYTNEVENVAMTLYVDCNVETSGDGSEAAPYKTVAEAQAKIAELKASEAGLPAGGIRVLIASGTYAPLTVGEANNGTESSPIYYVAEEERGAIFTDATILNGSDFESISAEEKARLDQSIADKVLKVDLKKYGLTESDWGRIYTLGTYHLASRYEGATGNAAADLYFNNQRMTLARYPNEGWLKTGTILDAGSNKDTPADYLDGATFAISDEFAERAAKWQTLDEVWTYGYFMYEWADCSNPIAAIDPANKTLTLGHGTFYGIVENKRYYAFNIFEELDVPGEYYIDRDNGILYFYPPADMEDSYIAMSCSFANPISGGGQYVNFIGLTACITRGNNIGVSGDHITFDHCFIYGGNNGFWSTGTDFTIQNCEVSDISAIAISLSGGDVATLTKSNNVIYNNYVHDFQKVTKTGYAGITIRGCGTLVSHNEISNAAFSAINWTGPYHTIEYNEIHDVCQESSDNGACYSGRSFTSYGTVFRYNYIHDLGDPDLTEDGGFVIGIYWDDGMSGQTAYGNIIENVLGWGFSVGGGRDNKVYNNIIINCSQYGLFYDSRARDGSFGGDNEWFGPMSTKQYMYDELISICYGDAWKEAYPHLSELLLDPTEENKDNPMLVLNPSNSYIANNILYRVEGNDWDRGDFVCTEYVQKFSEVHDNYVIWGYDDFPAAENSGWYLKENSKLMELLPDFEPIPFDDMGRLK